MWGVTWEWFQLYAMVAALLSTVCLLSLPSNVPKMKPLDNIAACLILGLALGWAMWPMCVWAVLKAERAR